MSREYENATNGIKAWVYFDGKTGNTATIKRSMNVSGVLFATVPGTTQLLSL